MPMTDDMARQYATEFVLQRYYLTDLDEARRKLSPAQFEGVLRDIEHAQAQISAQAQAASAPAQPDALRQRQRGRQSGISTPFGPVLPMTGALLVAIWIVFLLESLQPGGTLSDAMFYAFGETTPDTFTTHQLWRLVAACFLHANLLHIISNSIGLIWLGAIAERLYGRLRFLAIYLAAGIGGNVLTVLVGTAGVGASGAILGLLGALLAGFWRNRDVIDVRAGRQIFSSLAAMLVLNLATGFIPGSNISWQAHLGGAVTGGILALLIPFSSPQESRASATMAGVLSVVLIVVTIVLAATYPFAH